MSDSKKPNFSDSVENLNEIIRKTPKSKLIIFILICSFIGMLILIGVSNLLTDSDDSNNEKKEKEEVVNQDVVEDKEEKEDSSKAEEAEDVKSLIDYEIVYRLSDKRYDGGKNIYVLIDPVNLETDIFKSEIKDLIKEIVSKEGSKISIEFYDNKNVLELSYHQYGDSSLGRLLTESETEERVLHNIAGYSGELETDLYLNTLYFFPSALDTHEKVGKHVEIEEFNF